MDAPSPRAALPRRSLASLLALLVLAAPVAADDSPAARPNVVLLLADDLGYGDLGAHGAPDVRTPRLDRLAREGSVFGEAYSASPVCSPTRVALLTGRYPQRFGSAFEDFLGPDSAGLDPAWQPTLAVQLKRAGYRTACYGKWNVAGESRATRSRFTPNAHGFDHWVGTHASHDYHTHRRIHSGRPDLYEDGRPVELEGYTPDLLADRAVRFIESAAGGERPFFLYVPWLLPHYPLQAPDDPTIRVDRATYAKMVEHLDHVVGRVLDALRRTGVAERTLVIFTSDNGGHQTARNHPFRGYKQDLDEGGIRVPLMLRWPGVIPARRRSEQLAITMDVTATVLSATGVEPDVPLDGIDLLPVATGRAAPEPRTLFWRRRSVDRTKGSDEVLARAVRDGRWKLHVRGEREELYDLREDAGERNDLRAERPEVAAYLRGLLLAWEEEVSP